MRIYVASSTRNTRVHDTVKRLRADGHDVYDFQAHQAPDRWKELDRSQPSRESEATYEVMKELMQDPEGRDTFLRDMAALDGADAVVCVLPCNRSAHLELGFAIGRGKLTAILWQDPERPDLMHAAADHIAANLEELAALLRQAESDKKGPLIPPRFHP